MIYLIVGLGNPGERYQSTRHNIGFLFLDYLLEGQPHKKPFQQRRYGWITHFQLKGKKVVLLKPSTYVNRSGEAVCFYVQQLRIPLEQLMVVYDDVALPFGRLRLRAKGSSGGHNGMKSIITALQTEDFPRLRFGIGSDFVKGEQARYVLSPFPKEQWEQLPKIFERAQQCLLTWVFQGIHRAMNFCNAH